VKNPPFADIAGGGFLISAALSAVLFQDERHDPAQKTSDGIAENVRKRKGRAENYPGNAAAAETDKVNEIKILKHLCRRGEQENVQRQQSYPLREEDPDEKVYQYHDENVAEIRSYKAVVDESRDKHLDREHQKKRDKVFQAFVYMTHVSSGKNRG
jgi:hypothetical protein